MALVQFYDVTPEQFKNLTTKDESALYFLSNGQLYKGGQLIGNNIELITDSFPSTGVKGILYIKPSTGESKYWDGTQFLDFTKEITTLINAASTDEEIPTAAAVRTYASSVATDKANAAQSNAETNANKYTDSIKTALQALINKKAPSADGVSADSALKLTTSAGDVNKPVYFKDGVPVGINYTINKTVPSDAKFTDTTYENATQSAAGLMSAEDKKRLDGLTSGDKNQNAFSKVVVGSSTIEAETTTDTLTIAAGTNVTLTPDVSTDKITIAAKDTTYTKGTGINISDTNVISNAGVRSISSGSVNGTISVNTNGTTADVAVKGLGSAAYATKGGANGVAELDANGKVLTSQLPSYVDEVVEYSGLANFPTTGTTGIIYVDTATNKTYRWSGTKYVEISASLALGNTSSTAFRGDYGHTLYSNLNVSKGSDTKPIYLKDGVPTEVASEYVTLDTAQTITGNKIFTGVFDFSNTTGKLSSHYYHRLYSDNNVYVHYYDTTDFSKTTTATFRVSDATNKTFKALQFSGDGNFKWDNSQVLTEHNYGSYIRTLPYLATTQVFSPVAGRDVNLTAGTSRLYANALVISNPTTADDVGWVRVTGTGESDTVLELATGDDGGGSTCESIVARQYNTSNEVARQAVLLASDGASYFPVSVSAPVFIGSLSGTAEYAKMLSLKGGNTIQGTTNDTVTNWGKQYASFHFYSVAGYLKNQPSQYGFLYNIAMGGPEVHQIWFEQPDGRMLHRGGNSAGWNGSTNNAGTWKVILDSANYNTYALPLYGGTLTGNINYTMYSSTQTPFKVYGGDVDGQGISIGAGAATLVGSGESAKWLESQVSATSEELHLASDGIIKFWTNCQSQNTGAAVTVYLDGSRNFYPATNGSGSVGTSGNKWNTMYANTFYGALSGNASTASQWATARTVTHRGDFTGSYSISGAGNVTDTAYINYLTCGRNDSNTTYSYHRIMTVAATTSWVDNSAILIIDQGFNGGGFGIAKVSFRTNDISKGSGSLDIRWLVRNDLPLNTLQGGLYLATNNAYADIYYYATDGYAGATIRVLQNKRGVINGDWTLMNSQATGNGPSGTNTANTNVYAGVSYRTYTSTVTAGGASKSDRIYDSYNGTTLSFSYANSGLASTSWFAAWNGTELRAISPVNSRKSMSAMSATFTNYYYGMGRPDGDTTDWIRTTVSGIIPYRDGGVSAGNGSLGTSTWYFANSYINHMTAQKLSLYGNTDATMTSASTNPQIVFSENGSQPVHLIYSDYDSYRSPAGLKVVGGTNASPAWFEVEGALIAGGTVTAPTFSGSLSGNATTATTASVAAKLGQGGATSTPMTFNWSGKSGQPAWLWGGNDESNMYVYNPSNFSVNYATYAAYLSSRGAKNPQTGRTQAYGNVYSYNTNASAYTGAPTTYTSVIGFGQGTAGTVEIAGEWTGGRGLWARALRDSIDDWYSWQQIYTSNYHPIADRWSTARTLTLTGSVTGSVSIDGSGNVTLATTANNVASTGFGASCFTYFQTSNSFAGSDASWAGYLISNHGAGATYFNQILRMPFWSTAPQYSYMSNGTQSEWYTLHSTGNSSKSATYSSGLSIGNVKMADSTSTYYVPYATSSQAGVVSTAAQTFAGVKTFNNGLASNGNISLANGTYIMGKNSAGKECRILTITSSGNIGMNTGFIGNLNLYGYAEQSFDPGFSDGPAAYAVNLYMHNAATASNVNLFSVGGNTTYGNTTVAMSNNYYYSVVRSLGIYNRTTTSAANVFISSSGGVLMRSTSASKYKLNIKKIEQPDSYYYNTLKLSPKQWNDKGSVEAYANYLTRSINNDKIKEDEEEKDFLNNVDITPVYGLVAEDVEKAGLEKYCVYAYDEETQKNEIEGIQYDRLWIPLIPVVRDIVLSMQKILPVIIPSIRDEETLAEVLKLLNKFNSFNEADVID